MRKFHRRRHAYYWGFIVTIELAMPQENDRPKHYRQLVLCRCRELQSNAVAKHFLGAGDEGKFIYDDLMAYYNFMARRAAIISACWRAGL